MINIHKFEMSMKIRWVKQIIIGSKMGWFNLLLHDTDLSYLPTLGSLLQTSLILLNGICIL